MARIKVKLPDSFIFTTEVPIRIGDINYGGHLGHDVFLPIAHESRIRFFAEMCYDEMNLGGYGIILAGATIEYIKESFYGDSIVVNLGVNNFHKCGFDIVYQLLSKKNKAEIGRVITALVLYDYRVRKVVRLPGQVIQSINNFKPNQV